MTIRHGASADLPALLALIASCVDAPGWPAGAWKDLLSGALDENPGQTRLLLFAADPAGRLCGVLVANLVAGHTELESVLVPPAHRRQGIGRALLDAWLAWADVSGADGAQLEVREGNLPALHLYERLGLVVQARRASYYHSPVEDALLMGRQLRPG